jgi:uncharacterized protein YjbJ (UPF0337 family)
MNNEQFKEKWHGFKDKIQEKWRKLTDADITQISGKRDQLLAKLQSKYGWQRDHAEEELKRFEQSISRETGYNNPESFQEGAWSNSEEMGSWKHSEGRRGHEEKERTKQWKGSEEKTFYWGEGQKGHGESERVKREKEQEHWKMGEKGGSGKKEGPKGRESERLKRERREDEGFPKRKAQ